MNLFQFLLLVILQFPILVGCKLQKNKTFIIDSSDFKDEHTHDFTFKPIFNQLFIFFFDLFMIVYKCVIGITHF